MRIRIRRGLLAAAVLGVLAGAPGWAKADLVLSPDGFPSPAVIDFSQFSGPFQFTAGPVQIGTPVGQDITWTTSFPFSVIGNGRYGLASNGFWDSGRNGYTGLNTSVGSMTFTFNSGPVSAVGGFLNYAPGFGTDVMITALDARGGTLESYDINLLAPIITPSQADAGAFRGIQRTTADIAAFRVSNSYVVLDDLTFSAAAAVPEPSTLLGGTFGVLAALGYGWRRRRAIA